MDLTAYSDSVRTLLSGSPLMPLVSARACPAAVRKALTGARPERWFPGGRAPEAALAGLWLRFGAWTESHEIAQDIHTAEGSYWHGIVHRQEPDDWNSGYWFRQVGRHPVFGPLANRASALSPALSGGWDPMRFINYCASVRRGGGSETERIALEVQEIEWWLLFGYCALPA